MVSLFLLLLVPSFLSQDLRDPDFLAQARKGFVQIYSLDYPEAAATFSALKRAYPEHPAPPLYHGVVIWLVELFEREELSLNTFAAPGYFTKATDQEMKADRRKMFFDETRRSLELSQAILREDPGNKDARYFRGSVYGILGSFAITVDRSLKQASRYGKRAFKHHRQLIREDPEYYDAYMSVGLYEHIVDKLPWYIKWLTMFLGYRGSEEKGFEYLSLAAERAPLVADDARTLQMALYVHEGRNQQAPENARYLHQKYPRNYILHLNRAQILEKMGRRSQAVERYREVVELAEAKTRNYQKLPLSTFRYRLAEKFRQLEHPDSALEQFRKSIQSPETPDREKALSHLGVGQILDVKGERQAAVSHYQLVLGFRKVKDSHRRARSFLKRPYRKK